MIRTTPSQRQYAREFFNWPVLLVVVLFTLNNWWWKPEFHSWITGKLSDFLFCFFFPLYCSALLSVVTHWKPQRRMWVGALVTLIAFSAMKSSPLVSAWLSEVVSIASRMMFGTDSVNVVDPTDLIAAPFVLIAVWFGTRRGGGL